MSVNKYPKSMVVFHWLAAFLMITAILLSVFYWAVKTYQLSFPRDMVFSSLIGHETAGFFLLLVTLLRVMNTYKHRHHRPASLNLENSLNYYLEKLAHFFLQYGVIILTLLGWATGNAKGYELRLFWSEALTMPNIVPLGNPAEASTNETYLLLIKLHRYMAFTMMAVVVMHIGAVILHKLQGHSILDRMKFK